MLVSRDVHWKNRVFSRSWKFRLPTNVHTTEVSKRLEVDFQQISIPWKCPKGWKLTSNRCPYHGSVQKVGSWLPTNFHTMEVSKNWKLTSNKSPYYGSVQKVGSIMEICWKSQWFPWSGEDTIFPLVRVRICGIGRHSTALLALRHESIPQG